MGICEIKIPLAGSDAELAAAKFESLSAYPQAAPCEFMLAQAPIFASGLAEEDVVSVAPDGDVQVRSRSGHSTIRILPGWNDKVLESLETLGCFWRSSRGFLGIDVPPEANVAAVMALLRSDECKRELRFVVLHYASAASQNDIEGSQLGECRE